EPPLAPPAERGEPLAHLAALADAAAAPYAALVRAQVAPGDVCVVIGASVRGRFAVAIAGALGAHPFAIDADAARRQAAIDAGARAALDGAAVDAAGALDAIHAQAAALGAAAVELKVIETTGTGAGRLRAVALAAAGGTAALLDGGGADDLAAPL